MKPGETFIDNTTFTCRHLIEAVQEDNCWGCCYFVAPVCRCPDGTASCYVNDIVFKDKGPVDGSFALMEG